MKRIILLPNRTPVLLLLFLALSAGSVCYSQTLTYAELQNEKREKSKKAEKYLHGGVASIVGSLAIGIWLKRRQFKRTNKYGTEVYGNEKDFWLSGVVEGLANVIAVILFTAGFGLVIWGLFTGA